MSRLRYEKKPPTMMSATTASTITGMRSAAATSLSIMGLLHDRYAPSNMRAALRTSEGERFYASAALDCAAVFVNHKGALISILYASLGQAEPVAAKQRDVSSR